MAEFLKYSGPGRGTVKEVKVKPGSYISQGSIILVYSLPDSQTTSNKFKSNKSGRIEELLVAPGDELAAGSSVVKISGGCLHPTVMKDMCAECGADLKDDNKPDSAASVAMVHSIPELKVSTSEATDLGKEDQKRLLKARKLVLLVDLDQTLIHTTNDNIPPNLRDVYHFQLYGPRSPWYHTRIRPRTVEFLNNLQSLFEFHICTFGARMYAHKIAAFLDPEGKHFSHRILSRDECFDARSKTANMSALFPCGDSMVCIIDDREDVWNFAPNLVHVKPYHFFKHTGDINAPPGLAKKENDEKEGIDFDNLVNKKKKVEAGGKASDKSKDSSASRKDNKSDTSKKGTDKKNDTSDQATDGKSDTSEKGTDKKNDTSVHPTDQKSDTSEHRTDQKSDINDADKKPAEKKTEVAPHDNENNAQDEATETKNGDLKPHTNNDTENTSDKTENSEPANSKDDKSAKSDEEKCSKPEKEKSSSKSGGDDKPESEDVKDDLELSDSDNDSDNDDDKNKGDQKSDDKGKDLVDVEDTDDYLYYLEEILKTIHKAYYDLYDQMLGESVVPDLKTVVPYVKRKCLQGVNLVMSGVVPTQVPVQKSKPFLLAKSLGASVFEKVTKSTTHLVAARPGTAKVNEAKKLGNISIVTPDWLWACAERWSRVDESLYRLGKSVAVTMKPPAHCSSPEIAFAERCAEVNINEGYSKQHSVVESDPFLAFSSEDLKGMDKEVDDILSGESDEDSDMEGDAAPAQDVGEGLGTKIQERCSSASSEESLSAADAPRGHKRKSEDYQEYEDEDSNIEQPLAKFYRGEEVPSDFEIEAEDDDEEVGGEDWSLMGAELERELGGS